MDIVRNEIIDKIWNDIHGRYKSIFYWMDGSKTEYHYDADTDAIVSDNGFSVKVAVPTDQLSRDYIYNFIENLEGDIAKYYLEHYKIVL